MDSQIADFQARLLKKNKELAQQQELLGAIRNVYQQQRLLEEQQAKAKAQCIQQLVKLYEQQRDQLHEFHKVVAVMVDQHNKEVQQQQHHQQHVQQPQQPVQQPQQPVQQPQQPVQQPQQPVQQPQQPGKASQAPCKRRYGDVDQASGPDTDTESDSATTPSDSSTASPKKRLTSISRDSAKLERVILALHAVLNKKAAVTHAGLQPYNVTRKSVEYYLEKYRDNKFPQYDEYWAKQPPAVVTASGAGAVAAATALVALCVPATD